MIPTTTARWRGALGASLVAAWLAFAASATANPLIDAFTSAKVEATILQPPGVTVTPAPSPLGAQRVAAPGPVRAVWISRFEWAVAADGEVLKATIADAMETVARNGFNMVLFQVRGQADVLYPSAVEPWSPLIGADPGFDPLAFAVEEAHARGLAIHAYLNLYPAWQASPRAKAPAPDTTPPHLYYTHLGTGPDSWEVVDVRGANPDPARSDFYRYLSPGNPAVDAHLRAVVREIAEKYAVDGIHLDRARYPSAETSFDARSVARFKGDGNPLKLTRDQWQRDQITRTLETIKAEAGAVRPGLPITAAVFAVYDASRLKETRGFTSAYHQYSEDSQGWLRAGAVDGVMPKLFFDRVGPAEQRLFTSLAEDYYDNRAGFRVIPGIGGGFLGDWELLDATWLESTEMADGAVLLSLGAVRNHDGRFAHLFEPTAAAGPANLATARTIYASHLLLEMVEGDGDPIIDGQVRLAGRGRPAVTGGDGRAALLEVPRGLPLKLTATKSGYSPQEFTVTATQPGTSRVRIVMK